MSKLIIFDFDGTMINSWPYYLEEARKFFPNRKHILTEKFVHKYGVKKLFKALKVPKVAMPFLLIYVKYKHYRVIKALKPYKGIEKVIKALQKDHKIGILSSNSPNTIKKFLKNNNLHQYVSFVDSSPFYYGKEKKLRRWLKKHPKYSYFYYIGDEERDIEAAHEAGVISIAVSWGTESRELLEQSFPDYIATKPADILRIVNEN